MAERRRTACFSFVRQDISRLLLSAKLYVVAAVVILGLLTCFGGLRGYLQTNGTSVNPAELYVMSVSNRLSHWIIYIGALVLLCDAPFRYPGDTGRIIRADRRTWLTGQLLFAFIALLLYFAVILGFFFLLTAGYWIFTLQWSDTVILGAAQGHNQVGIVFGLQFWPELLQMSPWRAFGLTVLLQFCMGGLMTAILSCAYINGSPKVGMILCTVFPLLDYILQDAFDFPIFHTLTYIFSPFSFSSLFRLQPIGKIPVLYAAIYLICVTACLNVWLYQQVKCYDFSSAE